jgi:hypothetical protein
MSLHTTNIYLNLQMFSKYKTECELYAIHIIIRSILLLSLISSIYRLVIHMR